MVISYARVWKEFDMKLSRHVAAIAVATQLVSNYPPLVAQAPAGNIGDPRMEATGRDPGCVNATLVSTGGPAPRSPQTLAIRWIGYSNFELAYNGQVFLLDAYYDRGPGFVPLGVKAADIKRANAILIGHGHSDHMSDAASIGARTGAMVIGGPPTTEKLATQSIDAKQVRNVTGKGGEVFEFKGVKIEAVLGRHGEPPPDVTVPINQALSKVTTPLTPAEQAQRGEVSSRGTSDRRVLTEGTIAYVLLFDNGFRLWYRDSAGAITDYEKAAMQRIGGRVDVALVATYSAYLNTETSKRALEFMEAYHPDVFIPAHHDAPMTGLWRTTEPMFQALHDANPNIITVSKTYREPTCFNTEDNIQRRRSAAK
jgi:L-ascorbate metabolism protein UlaG (beta-lactamase superfamily)